VTSYDITPYEVNTRTGSDITPYEVNIRTGHGINKLYEI
jgi:hypothetical protein